MKQHCKSIVKVLIKIKMNKKNFNNFVPLQLNQMTLPKFRIALALKLINSIYVLR